MCKDAVAFLKVLDAGAYLKNFAGDIFAKNEGVFDAEAVIPRWAIANLPVNGAVGTVSQSDP